MAVVSSCHDMYQVRVTTRTDNSHATPEYPKIQNVSARMTDLLELVRLRACMCGCFFFFPFILDVRLVGRTSRGHTEFLFHLPSAVIALIFLARRIQPFFSLVDRCCCCCCCIHIKHRFDLYSVPSNNRTGPTDANAFRGHGLTTQKGYTL